MSKGNFKLINRLYNQGFDLTPTAAPAEGEKQRAIVEGWSKLTGHKRLPLEVVTAKEGYGVITGHQIGEGKQFLIGIDVDSNIPSLSTKVKEHLLKDLGQFPLRVGQSPKFLAPVICDEILAKLQSKKYRDKDGNTAQIEILARGQYFNCEGPHPKGVEGQYAWHLRPMDLKQLPRMNTAMVKDLLRWFDQLCERNGYAEVGSTGQAQRSNVVNFAGGDDFMAEVEKPPLDIEVDEIKRQLSRLEASELDHDDWNAVGMGLYHQFGGSAEGFKLWASWSAQDKTMCRENPKRPRFDLALCRRKWQSFGGRKGQALTWASVIYRHGLNSSGDSAVDNHDEVAPAKVNIYPAHLFSGGMDFQQGYTFVDFLIRKLIPQSGLGVIYGASGIMKSFWALLAAYSVATGRGLRVLKQHKVVYFDGENGAALKLRLKALHEHLGGDAALVQENMFFNSSALALTDEKVYARYVEAMRQIGPAMVIIDTLSEARGGLDENSATDMQKLMNISKRLSKDLSGCVVLFVHHSGKGDNKALRGSSVIEASCDFVLRAERVEAEDGKRLIKIVTQKQRQGEQGLEFLYEAKPYDSGVTDGYGDPVTTLYLTEADGDSVNLKKVVRRGKNQVALLKAYDLLESVGKVVDVPEQIILENGWDASAQGVSDEDLLERYAQMQDGLLDRKLRKNYYQARLALINDGCLAVYDNVVVLLRRNT